MTNAAFFFEEEAYTVSGAQMMGRQAAGQGFLHAFAQHANVDALWGYSSRPAGAEAFGRLVRSLRPDRPVHEITSLTFARLREAGCLFYPGPDIGAQAWRRELVGQASWSLCGVNHTISTQRVMQGVAELLVAPVEPWDAVVCTSVASRDVIGRLLGARAEWLADRLGVKHSPVPRLPVIPLGVDCDAYAFSEDDRARARQALSLEPDDVAVLYLGRFAFRAKAHPFAMYRALSRAAAGRRVVLIEAGHFGSPRAAAAFAEARAAVCPELPHRAVDGLDAAAKRSAWAAADVFCSLSDNIQETFGLTPIEAMAAGLPTVVSDWDGYRDTVRDGIDGYRVPTLMPAAGAGVVLSMRHLLGVDDYNDYVGLVGQFTAVDIDAAASALRSLIDNAALRRRMGDAGRQRARESYDWRRIVSAYQTLWGELAEERRRHAADPPRRSATRGDPFSLFGSFATTQLGPESVIERGSVDSAEVIRLRQLAVFSFATPALPPDDRVERLLAQVSAEGPVRVRSILTAVAPAEQAWILCTLAWLAKLGAIRIKPARAG